METGSHSIKYRGIHKARWIREQVGIVTPTQPTKLLAIGGLVASTVGTDTNTSWTELEIPSSGWSEGIAKAYQIIALETR